MCSELSTLALTQRMILSPVHMAFQYRLNAELCMLTQLSLVLFGHKYLITNGKPSIELKKS